MKKILKYISLIGLSSFILTGNVKAVGTNLNNHHLATINQKSLGYMTFNQTVAGGKCSGTPIYCIDHGKSNVDDFSKCQATNVSGTAYAKILSKYQEHDQVEYMVRVIAKKYGDAKSSASNDYAIVSFDKWLSSNSLNDLANELNSYISLNNRTKLSNSSKEMTYTKEIVGNNAIVNISLKLAVPNLSQNNFSTTKGAINSVSYNNGTYLINVTTPIESCKGGDFQLKVNLNGTVTASSNGVYLINCPGKLQNYIVNISNKCSISDIIPKESDDSETYDITIPDENCSCKASTSLSGKCDTNGNVKDLEDDTKLKYCISQGGFEEFCGTSLKKENDTQKNAKQPILSKTKPEKTTVNLGGNNYCEVYCLEQIDYDFPGEIDTQNGSYFKLKRNWNKSDDSGSNMKITGTRTCYTTEIKKDKFISEVKNIEERIRLAWNDYQRNKAIDKAVKNKAAYAKTGSMTCGTTTSTVPVTSNSGTNNKNQNKNQTQQTTTTSVPKTVSYTYYAADLIYKEELGTSNSIGAWNNNINNKHELFTWGVPTCQNDALVAGTDPEVNLNETYKALLTELANKINEYKSCTEWTNNYCFDPKIKFSYDEVYKDVEGEIEKTISDLGTTTNKYISINDSYTDGTKSAGTSDVQYIYVDSEDSNIQTSSIDLSTLYMKEEVKKEATYKDAVKEVYTYHPYGTIVTDKSKVEKQENLKSLGYVFPVALQHDPDTGVYNYYLSITNIGVGGNDAKCANDTYTNKIMGDSCSIFNTKNEVTAGKEYVCQYKTKSCPECEVECVCPPDSPNCYVEDQVCKFKECPTCKVECVGCIWNNGDTTVSYKTISLDDVYVDDSQKGQNWSDDAVQEIESKGQEIYSNTPVFEIDLTPTLTSKIRAYNAENKEYSNDTLSCSANNSSNSYYCTSSFLKDFLSQQHANYKDFDRK